jgi:D,D-heptose 1,7-bisphosphate phosphatase
MKLIVLTGGKGTRLGLTSIPKPMVSIGGKPLLEHQIGLAARHGIKDVFFLSGHLSNVISDYFSTGERWGIRITHLVEPRPLGTAGCLRLLEHHISPDERFLVFYGDVALDFDIDRFIAFDKLHNESLGTLLVHPNDHPYDSDLLEHDDSKRITRFFTKPHPDGLIYRNLVNAAVYILSGQVLNRILPDLSTDLARDVFPLICQEKAGLFAYNTPEYVRDIGVQDRLEEVRGEFAKGLWGRRNLSRPQRAVFLDRDGVINANADVVLAKDFNLLPGVADAVRLLNKNGYLAILVTNQPALAKGFLTSAELANTHKQMETLLGHHGAHLDGIYVCPHHPEKGFDGEVPTLKIDCSCRKPKPGLILQAQKDLNIDLASSWLVGDSERDILAGKAAGVRSIQIGSSIAKPFSSPDLLSAVTHILKQGEEG